LSAETAEPAQNRLVGEQFEWVVNCGFTDEDAEDAEENSCTFDTGFTSASSASSAVVP
jgi:hypothetical protein